jgi:glycine amidinotransferase
MDTAPVVSAYNEWDPLEEVLVGTIENAVIPEWDPIDRAAHSPEEYAEWYRMQGQIHPQDPGGAALKELNEFVRILEGEGVTVRRPRPFDLTKEVVTPFWKWGSGFDFANPRDLLMVIGDTIIEASSPRRGRQFESLAWHHHLTEYMKQGAKWVACPRPRLDEATFVPNFKLDTKTKTSNRAPLRDPSDPRVSCLTEVEPVLETADFMRCGRDIFYHRSFVTNALGVQWLQNIVGPEYRFHEIDTLCRRPFHIDTTFLPLAPGKAIANPEFAPPASLPNLLKKWDILYPPPPVIRPQGKSPFDFSSNWLVMNVVSLDSERVLVDAYQEPLIAQLREFGMKPIPVHFQNCYEYGGGLHCFTVDIRRRGKLESYF